MDGLSKTLLKHRSDFDDLAAMLEDYIECPISYPCVAFWEKHDPLWDHPHVEIAYVYMSDFDLRYSPGGWSGDPVYHVPTACRDARNTYRVFHRDIEGRVIAEFYGDNARTMAERFCEIFGEPSGSKR